MFRRGFSQLLQQLGEMIDVKLVGSPLCKGKEASAFRSFRSAWTEPITSLPLNNSTKYLNLVAVVVAASRDAILHHEPAEFVTDFDANDNASMLV